MFLAVSEEELVEAIRVSGGAVLSVFVSRDLNGPASTPSASSSSSAHPSVVTVRESLSPVQDLDDYMGSDDELYEQARTQMPTNSSQHKPATSKPQHQQGTSLEGEQVVKHIELREGEEQRAVVFPPASNTVSAAITTTANDSVAASPSLASVDVPAQATVFMAEAEVQEDEDQPNLLHLTLLLDLEDGTHQTIKLLYDVHGEGDGTALLAQDLCNALKLPTPTETNDDYVELVRECIDNAVAPYTLPAHDPPLTDINRFSFHSQEEEEEKLEQMQQEAQQSEEQQMLAVNQPIDAEHVEVTASLSPAAAPPSSVESELSDNDRLRAEYGGLSAWEQEEKKQQQSQQQAVVNDARSGPASPAPNVSAMLSSLFAHPDVIETITNHADELAPYLSSSLPLYLYHISLYTPLISNHALLRYVFAQSQLHVHTTCALCGTSPIIGLHTVCTQCHISICATCLHKNTRIHDPEHATITITVPEYEAPPLFPTAPPAIGRSLSEERRARLAARVRDGSRKVWNELESGLEKVELALTEFLNEVKMKVEELMEGIFPSPPSASAADGDEDADINIPAAGDHVSIDQHSATCVIFPARCRSNSSRQQSENTETASDSNGGVATAAGDTVSVDRPRRQSMDAAEEKKQRDAAANVNSSSPSISSSPAQRRRTASTLYALQLAQIRDMGLIHNEVDEETVCELLFSSKGDVSLTVQWMAERLDMCGRVSDNPHTQSMQQPDAQPLDGSLLSQPWIDLQGQVLSV